MPKRILVVDDEPDILDVVTFRLRKAGYEVLTAADGREALEIARLKKPHVIVLDVLLPVMNGHKVLRQLQMDEVLKKISVIFITAQGNFTTTQKHGYKYILKPFRMQELLDAIAAL